MPRPPTKRNRLTSKAPPASSKKNAPSQESSSTSREQANSEVSKSTSVDEKDAGNSFQPGGNASLSDIRQQLKSQTPTGKVHEQAIDSSPMGERIGTGSRPPTRARGYSSTLSLAGRKGDMSSKIPGTPAFESSILSNFRRRPRQASILQMMQAEDGSSDLDDDDFLGGLSPDDESTPLNLSRGKSLLIRQADSSPSRSSLPSSGGSRKRKRATEELQVPQSPLGIVENTPIGTPASQNQDDDAADSSDLSPPPESLDDFNQTLASPLSSSVPQSPAHSIPAPRTQAQSATAERTRKPIKDVSSDKFQLSTAILQDKLLPRRRQRQSKRRNVTGHDVSSDVSEDDYLAAEHDDDELSYLPTKKQAKPQRRQADKPKPRSNTRAKSKPTRQDKQETGPTKKGQSISTNESTESSAAAKRSKQTYARFQGPHVVEENQRVEMSSSPLSSALDSDAFESNVSSLDLEPTENFLSEEMRLQAMKFAEVDKWEMEFEDVMTSGSQGSSCR